MKGKNQRTDQMFSSQKQFVYSIRFFSRILSDSCSSTIEKRKEKEKKKKKEKKERESLGRDDRAHRNQFAPIDANSTPSFQFPSKHRFPKLWPNQT